MGKLKLDLDAIEVDSFETGRVLMWRGTVVGRESLEGTFLEVTCGQQTCQAVCVAGSQQPYCAGGTAGGASCAYSCLANTCQQTCANTCRTCAGPSCVGPTCGGYTCVADLATNCFGGGGGTTY